MSALRLLAAISWFWTNDRQYGDGATSRDYLPLGHLPSNTANTISGAAKSPSAIPMAPVVRATNWKRNTLCDSLDLGDARAYKDLGSHRGLVSC